jgi:hypothetical protein
MKPIYFALVLLMLSASASAEMEKTALSCETGMCLYWWPKLPPIKGWHQDREQSYNYRANALAPDGFTFADAETVMYATAFFKPRIPETRSLEMLIANDKKQFLVETPGITITETKVIMTADGKRLRSFTFFPTKQGNWERVSYGEEGEFDLVFTISSRTEMGYDRAIATYESLLGSYREKL